ncbi:MAG: hypothetical protein AABM41_00190 [Chloroflexota bacterium]
MTFPAGRTRLRASTVVVLVALVLMACTPAATSFEDQAAQLPQAAINGVRGAWSMGCWNFSNDPFGMFGTSVCDGSDGPHLDLPPAPPYTVTFTASTGQATPSTLSVAVGGGVEVDHALFGQGEPRWWLSFDVPLGDDGALGAIPDGPWTSLHVFATYPRGDIQWSWPTSYSARMTPCTEAFASGVADASLAWAETFEMGMAPGGLTDPLVPVEEGLDRLADHLDSAIASCQSSAAWDTAWATFLPQVIDGRDADAFLEARCAVAELEATTLCRRATH